jgi:hypothetical protein
MNSVPSIDLHPDKIGGDGPEFALAACRSFLERCLRAGAREVRIITGLGLRGDGTPRLRTRVEQEILGAYVRQIEQQSYEQGGAVIHLWLKPTVQKPGPAWQRQQRRAHERARQLEREERILVAQDRLRLAEEALESGDLRRARLKLNQVAKEFGWELAESPATAERMKGLLEAHWEALAKKDAS